MSDQGKVTARPEDMAERTAITRSIIIHARAMGLNPTREHVQKNYRWWVRWHTGAIPMGYLIKTTGIGR